MEPDNLELEPERGGRDVDGGKASPPVKKLFSTRKGKDASFQVTVVDAKGQRRRGVPITLHRSTDAAIVASDTVETSRDGSVAIWLKDLRPGEKIKVEVAGKDGPTIDADDVDPGGLVTVRAPLKPGAATVGMPAESVMPRREYSPPAAKMLASQEQYVIVPHTAGCDVPVPATQASSEFLVYQLVRRPDDTTIRRADLKSVKPLAVSMDPMPVAPGVRFGDRVTYRQSWRLLGHSLGDLVYSLPLAPLESVNLATVEWTRQDAAARSEATAAAESLLHAQLRDRSVTETVATAVTEYQGGFAILGGAAGVGGPAVGAIGGGTSHSWGNRNLVGESVQVLSDAVQQASEVMRSQTSTVVIQASQAESDTLQTRTVSNYNQNHALTVQYYEVLRHFEVATAFESIEPVLLVPFVPVRFDRETILRFRRILERHGLDARMPEWIDATERLGFSGNYPPEPASNTTDGSGGAASAPSAPAIDRLQIRYMTGGQTTVGYVTVDFGLRNGTWVRVDDIPKRGFGIAPLLEENKDYVADVTGGDIIGRDPGSIERVRVSWSQNGLQDGWKFKGIEILFGVVGGNGLEPTPLFAQSAADALRHFTGGGGAKYWTSGLFTAPQPRAATGTAGAAAAMINSLAPAGVTNLLRRMGVGGNPGLGAAVTGGNASGVQRGRADDAQAELLMLEHLNYNRLHYSKAVLLGMDGDERLRMLETILGDTDLFRDIDYEPVGVSGNYLAFPYRGDRAPALDKNLLDSVRGTKEIKRHLNLPTRGVFAETHLSHCPAREQRDPTRMYSAAEIIMPAAPPITGVQPGSRNAPTETAPTPLSAPVVNIQNPPAAPDPAGLTAAFGLLGQMGPFRDMSTSQEVAGLLGQLASGALTGDAAKAAARRVQGALSTGQGGGAVPPRHPSSGGGARDLYDRMQVLRGTSLPVDEQARIWRNMADPGPAPAYGADGTQFAGFNPGGGNGLASWRSSRVLKEGEGVADAVVQLLKDPLFDAPVQNRFEQTFTMSTGDFYGGRLILWPRASDLWYLEGDRILSDRPDQFLSMLEWEAVLDKVDKMGWLLTMAEIEMQFMIAFTAPLFAIAFGNGVGFLAHLADPALRGAIVDNGPKAIAAIKFLRENANECFGCIVKNVATETLKNIPSNLKASDFAYLIGRILYSGRGAIAKDTIAATLTPLREMAKANLITVPLVSALKAGGGAAPALADAARQVLADLQAQNIPVGGGEECVRACLAALRDTPNADVELQNLGDSLEAMLPAVETLLGQALGTGTSL